MVPPSSHNMAQPSSRLDWTLLERIAWHMPLHAAADALPQQVQDLLQVSKSCSSCWALQKSLPTPQRAGQQKAALFISYLSFREVFLSEHCYVSQRFLCTKLPSDMAPSAQARKFGQILKGSASHVWALLTCIATHQRWSPPANYEVVLSSSSTERVKLVHI